MAENHKLDVDVYITRRQRIHIVRNPAGEQLAAFQFLRDILDYCTENQINTLYVDDEDGGWLIDINRRPW